MLSLLHNSLWVFLRYIDESLFPVYKELHTIPTSYLLIVLGLIILSMDEFMSLPGFGHINITTSLFVGTLVSEGKPLRVMAKTKDISIFSLINIL